MSRIFAKALLQAAFILLLTSVGGLAWGKKGELCAGAQAGIGMSSFQPVVAYPRDYYYRPVPVGGIFLTCGLGEVVALRTEINYLSISTQRDGMLQFDGTPLSGRFADDHYGYFSERISADYIEVPLMLDGSIGGRFRLLCGAGIFAAFRLRAVNSTTGSSYIYADSAGAIAEPISAYAIQNLNSNRDITSSVRPVNCGGTGHIGVSCKAGGGRVGVDARCSFGFGSIWTGTARPGVNKTVLLAILASYTMPIHSCRAAKP